MRTARAFFADCSDEGTVANLEPQDLGAFCEPGDQIAGCSVEDGGAAVTRELARMHAHFVRARIAGDGRGSWRYRPPARAPAPDFYVLGVAVFEARYAADMEEDMAMLRAFASRHTRHGARRRRMNIERRSMLHLARPAASASTAARPNRVPESDPLADLGELRQPAVDLAHSWTGSLSVEDRRACERALIADHAAVLATVDPADSPNQRAEREYRVRGRERAGGDGGRRRTPDTPHNRAPPVALATLNVAAMRDWNTLAAPSTAPELDDDDRHQIDSFDQAVVTTPRGRGIREDIMRNMRARLLGAVAGSSAAQGRSGAAATGTTVDPTAQRGRWRSTARKVWATSS
ncbi:hypothetical protein AB5I41_11165 [Sphingomonas sp. MMS24-JH45]